MFFKSNALLQPIEVLIKQISDTLHFTSRDQKEPVASASYYHMTGFKRQARTLRNKY